MMPANETEVVKELVIRTKENYKSLKGGPYEVTQLLNSAICLLIIPQQKLFDRVADNLVSEKLFNRLLAAVQQNSYKQQLNLSQLARHLRNSIAHARIKLIAEKPTMHGQPVQIQAIEFKDENKQRNESITIQLDVDLLAEFFDEFSTAISSLP